MNLLANSVWREANFGESYICTPILQKSLINDDFSFKFMDLM